MADVVAIFTTHLCLFYIVIRAVMLDRTEPWFEERRPSRSGEATGAKARTGF